MFFAALFTIAMTWKQPQCPSTDEWMKKLWYIYTTEYYSVIKRNAFESVLKRWINLDPIIQSEVSQKKKNKYSILTHKYGILMHYMESRKMVMMKLFAGQQWRHRHRVQTYGYEGRR